MQPAPPSRLMLILAFASIYIIWGSTYLAIRFSIETMPPILMAGIRFLIAGLILFAFVIARGAALPTRAQWYSGALIGFGMLLMGNGLVCLAEQHMPSGIAALIVSTVPLWFVMLDWLIFKGEKPTLRVVAGLLMGFLGIVVLIGPDEIMGTHSIPALGVLMLVLATIGWSAGSLYAARRAAVPANPLMGTAVQMICGGVLLILAGSLHGEWGRFHMENFSSKSLLAFLYLIIFGSLIGFTAYSWLVRVVRPSIVSTYAYVNPVIAVLLGWAFANEPLQWYTMAGAAVIIGAVVIITTRKRVLKQA